jgi:hypothetical protein
MSILLRLYVNYQMTAVRGYPRNAGATPTMPANARAGRDEETAPAQPLGVLGKGRS